MLHDFERISYLTKDRSLDIDFVFMDCGDIGWRIYIISSIDYKRVSSTRSGSSACAHWLKESNETYPYICWNTKIESLEDAKKIAAVWSDCTAYYIANGGEFNEIVNKI